MDAAPEFHSVGVCDAELLVREVGAGAGVESDQVGERVESVGSAVHRLQRGHRLAQNVHLWSNAERRDRCSEKSAEILRAAWIQLLSNGSVDVCTCTE